jgi:glycosyltransferase involved in cell wall biosynthesis
MVSDLDTQRSPAGRDSSSQSLTSIIIPTYNRADQLRRALQSAASQTAQETEIIVVDDGSADRTPSVVESFADPRVVYVRHHKNLGKAASWVSGLDHARGEFVAFLSDDDLMSPSFVERRRAQLELRPSASVTLSPYEVRTIEGQWIRIVGDRLPPNATLESFELLKVALSREWFWTASLYRRRALVALPERVTQAGNALDMAINVELALRGASGVVVPHADFTYTDHPGQAKYVDSSATFRHTAVLLERVLAEVEVASSFKRALRRELSNWYVVWARRVGLADPRLTSRRLADAIRADPCNGWALREALLFFVALGPYMLRER